MSRNPFIDEDEFLRGYIECAIWSTNDPDTEIPLNENFDAGDLDPEWENIAREDCAVFCRNHAQLLVKFGELTGRGPADLGHDFWLTRNHHGAGFWDRYMDAENPKDRAHAKELGNRLTMVAQFYPERNLMPIGQGLIGE